MLAKKLGELWRFAKVLFYTVVTLNNSLPARSPYIAAAATYVKAYVRT